MPVAPDAFFSLEDAKGRSHFFLEADRGTMTVKRFSRKLLGYAAWWREKRHTEKFGIRFFRVLTVATSFERTRHLKEAAEALEDLRGLGRMFLFTGEGNIALSTPESFWSKIWAMPGEPEPGSLLGGEPGAGNLNTRRELRL